MADVYTNLGRGYIGGILAGTTTAITAFFGNVGTGATVAVVTATTISTEVATARIGTTATNPTTTLTGDTAQHVFTYTATGSITVTNAGVGKTSTIGAADILQLSDFTGIPIVSGDSIQFTFKAQIV